MARCILSQETPVPAPDAAPQASAPQDQKSAQEPKSEISVQDTTSTFKIRVNLVQVHVVIRDSAGKPVGGLRKEDFQLYDNNKLQAITTFAIEDAESRKERREAAAKTQLDSGETDAQVAGTAPERFVSLTFDDVHLLMTDVAPMRNAASGFIDSIGLSDRVGVFTTSGVVTQDFTSNKELLKQTILKVISRARSNTGTCPNVSYDMAIEVAKDPTAYTVLYEQAQACAPGLPPQAVATLVSSALSMAIDQGEADFRNVYRELDIVLRILSSRPGERVLLLASPGFAVAPELSSQTSEFVDHANRSNIVINTIDARGLYTADLFGDISEPYAQPAQMAGQAASVGLSVQMEKQFVLGDFAYGTGGRFFHNSNDLEGGLKQLGIAPEASYVLGFSPRMEKMDGHFHTIKVTLTGKQKYTVQARHGYFAPKKLEDPAEMAKEEIREAVFSRDEIGGLPFRMQTQYFKSGGAGAQLSVVAHVDLNGARFRKAEGRNFNDVTVATVLFDEDGNFVAGGEKLVNLRLFDTSLERLHRTGLVVKSTYEVKPGKYLVRQVVRESEGSQISAHSGIVVIPD
jgi:VWFA-related protein